MAITAILQFCFLTIFTYAADDVHLLSKGYGFDLVYTYLGSTVENMPLEIRDVPVHEDDSGYEGPINKSEYTLNHSFAISIMYSRVYGTGESDPLRFNWGLGFDWLIGMGDNFEERNYMNSPGTDDRGYGAALTYVKVGQGGIVPPLGSIFSDIFLNWSPRVKLEVAPFGGALKNLWFGSSVSYYRIYAQNGWDRYDSLEVRDSYDLAHVIPVRVYAKLLNMSSDGINQGIMAGAQFQPDFLTSVGDKSKLSIDPITFFMGFCFDF